MYQFIFPSFVILSIFFTITSNIFSEKCRDNFQKKEVADLLSKIQAIKGYQTILSNNSTLHIETDAINLIVKMKHDILDVLLIAMQDEGISFDSFARCYCASNRIISKIDPKLSVPWSGGCEIREINDIARIYPGAQGDEKLFRKEIIIELKESVSKIINNYR